MPYKSREERKKYYDKNKDEINRKRREYAKTPEVKERLRLENKRWRENNRDLANERSRIAKKKYEDKARIEVFKYYGEECNCCKEDGKTFLTIDHINGGGTKHRKVLKEKIYTWLFRNNFPEGFQTLCFNCNWSKHINGGICEHKNK